MDHPYQFEVILMVQRVFLQCMFIIGQIGRIFISWKYRRDQIVVDRLKWQRSVQLCRQTVLHKCFNAWLQRCNLTAHKQVSVIY